MKHFIRLDILFSAILLASALPAGCGNSESSTGSAGAPAAGTTGGGRGGSGGGTAGSDGNAAGSNNVGGAAGDAAGSGGSGGAGGGAGTGGSLGGGGGNGGAADGGIAVDGSPPDARTDSDAARSGADAPIIHPPGWGIHCGALLCDASTQFCCLGATPSCLPHGSTACGANTSSLECDDRYDCCNESGCGYQPCCANQNETGPVKAQCGVCTGERVQQLCDPKGTPDVCGIGGPTHSPVCSPSPDAGSPRLLSDYPYCIPT